MIYSGSEVMIPIKATSSSKNLYVPVVASTYKAYFPGSAGRIISNSIEANVDNYTCGLYAPSDQYVTRQKMCRLHDSEFDDYWDFGITATTSVYSFYSNPSVKTIKGYEEAEGSENITSANKIKFNNNSSGRRYFNGFDFLATKSRIVKIDVSVVITDRAGAIPYTKSPTDIKCFLLEGSTGSFTITPIVLTLMKQFRNGGTSASGIKAGHNVEFWNADIRLPVTSGRHYYVTLPFISHELSGNNSGVICQFYYAFKAD